MANSETDAFTSTPVVDFNNTAIAFSHKSDAELKRTAWLFRLMNKSWLVKAGSAGLLWFNKSGLNIFNPLVKATIYKQFCGGTSLEDSQEAIAHLAENKTSAVLDYGAEGKSKEEDFEYTLKENIRAIEFAASHPGVSVISSKLTALASNDIFEKAQSSIALTSGEKVEYDKLVKRLHRLCQAAQTHGIAVFIDAEETWMQDTIDKLVKMMMQAYNRQKVVVYHTYQLYRKGKLTDLKNDHQEARANGYILGAKLVRGAYMEKERARALEKNYPSPIHDTKEDTDRDYNAAVRYCVDHYLEIAVCNGSHNIFSNQLQAQLIAERGLPRNHPHLNFCQLYGMSDYITFNLAHAGFNVAKYVPYGPVDEVIPYLVRRAKENSAVRGEMSRELQYIDAELARRGLK